MRSREYESDDELDSLDEKSIGDLKQWQLLLAICPIFGHDHPWRAFNQDTRDVMVIKRQSKLFATYFLEIPVHAPTNSALTGKKREDFERTIDALISSLECLVNGEKLPAQTAETTTALDPTFDFDLQRRCPNLLALSSLSQDGTFEHYSQYLYLSQNAKTFKKTCNEVKGFLERLEMLGTNTEPTPTRRALGKASRPRKEAQRKVQFSDTLWTRSKSLFESLVTSLRSCDRVRAERNERFPSHKAMLHLQSAQDQAHWGGQNPPEVCIALAACADQKIWHQIHCTLSPSEPSEYVSYTTPLPLGLDAEKTISTTSRSPAPVTPMNNICEAAEVAYEEERLFKIEHHGAGNFTDVSDLHYGPGTYPNAHPTISISDLLATNILKSPYRFYPYDKKVLAFSLAHALLQFSNGPWVQTLWTHDQVFFMYEPGTKTVYNVHQPWISCVLSEPVPPIDPLDTANKYPVILSFAKLLIELETGEELKLANKRHDGKTRNLVASLWEYCDTWNRRLLDDDYSQAVDACVNFVKYLSQHQKDHEKTEEEAVRDIILARIVSPLERRLDLSQKSNWGHQNLNLHNLVPTIKPQITRSRSTASHSPTTVSPRPPKQALQQSGSSRRISKSTAELAASHFSSKFSRENLNDLERKHDPSPRARPLTSTNVLRTGNKVEVSRVQRNGNTPVRPTPPPQKSGAANLGPSRSAATGRPLKGRFATDAGKVSTASLGSLPTRQIGRSSPRPRPSLNDKPAPVSARERAVSTTSRVSAPIETVSQFSNYLSGFGTCLQHDCKGPNDVSTTSFKHINMTVDTRMTYTQKDEPVLVAVLDTGFDHAHADFQQPRTKYFIGDQGDQANPVSRKYEDRQCDRIIGCRDFCRPDPGSDDVPDLDGHGTKVAGILLRVAPRAKLLIARVSLGENSGDVPDDQAIFKRPQPETVAKAIEWAVQEGADIINLSLGFRNYSWERLDTLRRALRTASNENVVIFAATSNDGAHEPVAWPANDRNLAIGVHSCTDNGGLRSEFTAPPSPNGVNFMVVGERILSHRLTSRGGGFELCSGSSFATPVAAAIGALVLAFTRQRVCRQNRLKVGEFIIKDLQTTSGMTKLLEAISRRTPESDGYWLLRTRMLWATYHSSSEDPAEEEEDARQHAWRIIRDALRP